MNDFLQFITLTDPNTRYVVLGMLFMSAGSAVLGCFTFLRKKSLIGDAIAHAVLPGVCAAFILSNEKNPFLLLLGALLSGWLAVYAVDFITSRTKLKQDTAIGIILSVFFGFGIVLLTSIQHSGNASQSGLDSFIFGKAASLISTDVYVFGSLALVLIGIVYLLYKEFLLLSFDPDYANAIGFPIKAIEFCLTTLTVLAVIAGIQAIGVILMAAILITPAAAARFWTNRLPVMIVLAVLFAILSGIGGAYISFQFKGMPTGPWVVIMVSCIAVLSILFAPKRGMFYRWYGRKKHLSVIQAENILKTFYKLGEQDGSFYNPRSVDELAYIQGYSKLMVMNWLNKLTRQGYLQKTEKGYVLTEDGKHKGQRVTKLHRLWEMYLTKYLNIESDHVHDDAENIEHIITPELEKILEEQLQYPLKDPHDTDIPYRK